MKMNDKTYEFLKWLILIVIPAITTFYCVLDGLFKWGYADVVGTVSAAFCAMVGTIIGISTANYYRNDIPPDDDE